MKPFQIVILGIFALFLVGGVVTFALFRGSSAGSAVRVSVWGTLPASAFDEFAKAAFSSEAPARVAYTEKDPDTFDADVTEALAAGRGPDVIVLPQDLIVREEDKIRPFSYDTFSERDFRNTFVGEGELYLTQNGILALPLAVDPLVLYWNRDLFSNEGLTLPPRFWDELILLTPTLTKRDKAQNIVKSAVALGEFRNVANAKGILSAILMQSGSPILARGADGRIADALSGAAAARSALSFYTEFANPAKPTYTWNRSLRDSEGRFLAGDSALYFGFASELKTLRAKNPNLNFDVARFPQPRDAKTAVVFGRMYGLAVLANSRNTRAAAELALALAAPHPVRAFSAALTIAPARRDLLGERQTSGYRSLFFSEATRARGWLDPNPKESELVFRDMVEAVTSGRATPARALGEAGRELEGLLPAGE